MRNDYDFDDTIPVGLPPFEADTDGNGIDDRAFDFTHLALHETGHTLGLGHFGTTRAINLMTVFREPLRENVNGAGIDAGSLDGAKDLYSIPEDASVPEPSTFLLLGSGLVGLAGWRWKNRIN